MPHAPVLHQLVEVYMNKTALTPKTFAGYMHHGEIQTEVPSLEVPSSPTRLPRYPTRDGTSLWPPWHTCRTQARSPFAKTDHPPPLNAHRSRNSRFFSCT